MSLETLRRIALGFDRETLRLCLQDCGLVADCCESFEAIGDTRAAELVAMWAEIRPRLKESLEAMRSFRPELPAPSTPAPEYSQAKLL